MKCYAARLSMRWAMPCWLHRKEIIAQIPNASCFTRSQIGSRGILVLVLIPAEFVRIVWEVRKILEHRVWCTIKFINKIIGR